MSSSVVQWDGIILHPPSALQALGLGLAASLLSPLTQNLSGL